MNILDNIKNAVSSSWQAASGAATRAMQTMFRADAEQAAALARLNRVLSVAVGIRGSPTYKNPEVRKAYAKLYREVRDILNRIAERDPSFRVVLPSDMDMGDIKIVQQVPRAEWSKKVRKLDVSSGAVNGLGAIPVLIVIAVVAVSAGAAGTSYLLTSEARQRMAVALASADAAAALSKAVAEGKISADDAKKMLDKIPPTPETSTGGLFDSLGKTMVLGGAGLLAFAYFTGRLSMPKLPKLAGVDGLGALKPRIKKNEWGEFEVVIKDGRKVVNGPYFTNDKQDAKDTAEAMLKESQAKESANG